MTERRRGFAARAGSYVRAGIPGRAVVVAVGGTASALGATAALGTGPAPGPTPAPGATPGLGSGGSSGGTAGDSGLHHGDQGDRRRVLLSLATGTGTNTAQIAVWLPGAACPLLVRGLDVPVRLHRRTGEIVSLDVRQLLAELAPEVPDAGSWPRAGDTDDHGPAS